MASDVLKISQTEIADQPVNAHSRSYDEHTLRLAIEEFVHRWGRNAFIEFLHNEGRSYHLVIMVGPER